MVKVIYVAMKAAANTHVMLPKVVAARTRDRTAAAARAHPHSPSERAAETTPINSKADQVDGEDDIFHRTDFLY
jgi:hypothetical protein